MLLDLQNWIRRRDFLLCLWRLDILQPPPSAPASSHRDPKTSAFMQRVLEKEAVRKREELRANAVATNASDQSNKDRQTSAFDEDSALMNVLSNYDLRRIIVTYI